MGILCDCEVLTVFIIIPRWVLMLKAQWWNCPSKCILTCGLTLQCCIVLSFVHTCEIQVCVCVCIFIYTHTPYIHVIHASIHNKHNLCVSYSWQSILIKWQKPLFYSFCMCVCSFLMFQPCRGIELKFVPYFKKRKKGGSLPVAV